MQNNTGKQIKNIPSLEEINKLIQELSVHRIKYQSAIRQMRTRLEILNDEFDLTNNRNPIHHMESRLKTADSIADKLIRRNLTVNYSNAEKYLTDIAGIRVVCAYRDDIYLLANLLRAQDDIKIIRERDYIKKHKQNGYRSLHLLILVPVYLFSGKVDVTVEVQIRTIAMDFWASLEHRLRYKDEIGITDELSQELVKTANEIADIDRKMQKIYNTVQSLKPKEPELEGCFIEDERTHRYPFSYTNNDMFSSLNK